MAAVLGLERGAPVFRVRVVVLSEVPVLTFRINDLVRPKML